MQENQFDISTSKAWRNLCLPKAELLLWLVLEGRVNTQDRLRKINVLRSDDTGCVLCGEADESVSHLFFTYSFAWKVWTTCCNLWGFKWVIASDPGLNFKSWLATPVGRQHRKAWLTCFYAIVWALWELRNKIIFRGEYLCYNSFTTDLNRTCRWWMSASENSADR